MDKEKAIGLFRLQLNGVFTPFHGYGHDVFIPEAQAACLQAALILHERLNGNDPIVTIKYNRTEPQT